MISTNKRSGFTLIEFIVFFAISTVVAMALFAILTNFIRSREHVFFGNRLLASSETVFNQLTLDIHDTAEIEISDLDRFELTLFNDEIVIYQFDQDNGRLTRNNQQLHTDTIKVADFRIIPRSPDGELPIFEFKLHLKSHDSRAAKAELQRKTTISLRSHRGEI